VHSPPDSQNDDHLITTVEKLLRLSLNLIPGGDEVSDEAAETFEARVGAPRQQALGDRDPFQLRIEELREDGVGQPIRDLVGLDPAPERLEEGKEPLDEFDVLLRDTASPPPFHGSWLTTSGRHEHSRDIAYSESPAASSGFLPTP
jgi:hypothetical protein